MKLNYYAFELLKIFENELRYSRRVSYQPYQVINVKKHILLEQDRPIDYYAWAIHELFVTEPPTLIMLQEFSKWQLIETYRIINTVLVSCAESINPIRSSLALLKTKLEAEPYLKELLNQIDNGQLQTDLVCSGHGVWYQKDGEIDLSHFPPTTTVYLYSGLGASLSDEVGTKIENAALEPNELVLQKKSTREIVAPSAPTLFSSSSQHSKIPNFCLINDKENLPLARVIEPLTGRTVYSIEDAPKKRNYFSLGNVLEKHQGRVIHWAACTGQRDDSGTRAGPFFGYKVTASSSKDVNNQFCSGVGTKMEVLEETVEASFSL